jgi:branched-chain amino acid transport system ATP-binding protein
MNRPLLYARNVSKSFGGVHALEGVRFQINHDQIVAVIGPNGSGKTTLFNLISGLLSLDNGEIWFDGHLLNRLKPHEIAALGIARTFQNVQLFGNMSVIENVIVGRYRHEHAGLFRSALGLTHKEERKSREVALRYLKRVGIAEKAELPALSLSLGEQRLLELARALACEPRLLLLDEPTAGLSGVETIRLAASIRRIQANKISVLLVEHDMSLVMSIAEWIVVLNYGKKLSEGRPDEVQNNPMVIEAYLGQTNRTNTTTE